MTLITKSSRTARYLSTALTALALHGPISEARAQDIKPGACVGGYQDGMDKLNSETKANVFLSDGQKNIREGLYFIAEGYAVPEFTVIGPAKFTFNLYVILKVASNAKAQVEYSFDGKKETKNTVLSPSNFTSPLVGKQPISAPYELTIEITGSGSHTITFIGPNGFVKLEKAEIVEVPVVEPPIQSHPKVSQPPTKIKLVPPTKVPEKTERLPTVNLEVNRYPLQGLGSTQNLGDIYEGSLVFALRPTHWLGIDLGAFGSSYGLSTNVSDSIINTRSYSAGGVLGAEFNYRGHRLNIAGVPTYRRISSELSSDTQNSETDSKGFELLVEGGYQYEEALRLMVRGGNTVLNPLLVRLSLSPIDGWVSEERPSLSLDIRLLRSMEAVTENGAVGFNYANNISGKGEIHIPVVKLWKFAPGLIVGGELNPTAFLFGADLSLKVDNFHLLASGGASLSSIGVGPFIGIKSEY